MKTISKASTSAVGMVTRSPLIEGLLSRYPIFGRVKLAAPSSENPTISARLEDRQAQLSEFYVLYEAFVECLCDAVQFGISEESIDCFHRARTDLIARYPLIRPYVSAFIRPAQEDAEGAALGIRFDAFDALLSSPTLEVLLYSDDGRVLSRIRRTREALLLYREHLRQLVERRK